MILLLVILLIMDNIININDDSNINDIKYY